MSETFEGAHAYNDEAEFELVSDPAYYEESGEGQQLYLDSVLPTAYDPTLEPFNTQGANPKSYPEQNEYGFHPILPNPYQYTYDNGDKYFTPENKEQTI